MEIKCKSCSNVYDESAFWSSKEEGVCNGCWKLMLSVAPQDKKCEHVWHSKTIDEEKNKAHDTQDNYCCACELDLAVFERKLEEEKGKIRKYIEYLIKEQGIMTDTFGDKRFILNKVLKSLEE